MKNFRKLGAALVAGSGLMAASVSSHAVIAAADLTTPLAAISTDALTVFTAVLPVMLTVMGLVIGYKLVKRFVGSI